MIANDLNVDAAAKRLGETVPVTEKWCLDEARARAEMDRVFKMARFRTVRE